MSFRVILAALLFSPFLPATSCVAAEAPAATVAEREAMFAWFDGLNYADVRKAPFVRYATGQPWAYVGKPPQNSYRYGFRVSDTGKQFAVVGLDLRSRTYDKTDAVVPEHERIGYENADLAKYTTEAVAESRDGKSDFAHMFSEIGETAGLFVLAWACDRQGHKEAADAALAQCEAIGLRAPEGNTEPRAVQSTRDRIRTEIAHAEMWMMTKQFGDAKISREQLLERHRRFLAQFPNDVHAPRAAAAVMMLEQQVAEDQAHAERRRNGKPVDGLPRDEQIAEWIFQLRNQNSNQFTQRRRIDLFDRWEETDDSPADHLAKFSFDAVPQLIAALDDRRITRSVDYEFDFRFTHQVLTVGDCAEAVLSRIAGRPFFQPKETWHHLSDSKSASQVKTDIEAWYAEYLRHGEKPLLLASVAQGEPLCVAGAKRLVDQYPEDALPALLSGARAIKDDLARARLIEQILRLPSPTTEAVLLAEVKQGPSTEFRLAAAEVLLIRGRREGIIEAVLDVWREKSIVPNRFGNFDEQNAAEAIARFLASCQSVRALDALSIDLARRAVGVRREAVESAGSDFQPRYVICDENFKLVGDDDAALRAAAIRFLANSLDDDETQNNYSGYFGDTEVDRPRVCDIAAYRLHELDPKRFTFNIGASLKERDRQRHALRNTLRKEQGLPPLADLVDPQPAVLREEVVGPLIDRVKGGGAGLAAAIIALEKLGPGALPVLVDRASKLPADDESRHDLETVAKRLASTIIAVEFNERSTKPSEAIAAKLAKLKHERFDPETLADALLEMTDSLTNDVPGIRVFVTREPDERGTTLRIDLLDRKRAEPHMPEKYVPVASAAPRNRTSAQPMMPRGQPVIPVTAQEVEVDPRNRPTNWVYSFGAVVDDELVPGATGGGGRGDPGLSRENLVEVLQSGAAAPPKVSLSIEFMVVGYAEPEAARPITTQQP